MSSLWLTWSYFASWGCSKSEFHCSSSFVTSSKQLLNVAKCTRSWLDTLLTSWLPFTWWHVYGFGSVRLMSVEKEKTARTRSKSRGSFRLERTSPMRLIMKEGQSTTMSLTIARSCRNSYCTNCMCTRYCTSWLLSQQLATETTRTALS